MKTTEKLVVLGSINVDHILSLDGFPVPGETVTGHRYQLAFGGKGANQAVAAGRSGANTRFIACVGGDETGRQVCKQLAADQVDISLISQCQQQMTGVALIFVNAKGENVIGIYPGANEALTPEKLMDYQQPIAEASVLLMQLESPVNTVLAAAKVAVAHQTKVVLNPAPAQVLPDALLELVDIITPNETEVQKLTGVNLYDDASTVRACALLHDKGIKTVIITLGSYGVWVSVEGRGKRIPGFKVNALDTTGAGDTFNGALVTMLLEGKPLDESIRFAHAAAAIAVTRYGAQPAIPWRDEIEQFLQQQG